MIQKAIQLLCDFAEEKLDNDLSKLSTFNLKTLKDSGKYGSPERYFDCDDTELMRAVYIVLWSDVFPNLSLENLGSGRAYRGDTMNTFHTLFGREIPEKPGFYAGLEKYEPSDELRAQVRHFGNNVCSTLGNYVVLPNNYAADTTLNLYRGTNHWRDFFDRFLISLYQELGEKSSGDKILQQLVENNAGAFAAWQGESNCKKLLQTLLLEDYCDNDMMPKEVFLLNYHWMDPSDRESYFQAVGQYLVNAENIIRRRGERMVKLLEQKIMR